GTRIETKTMIVKRVLVRKCFFYEQKINLNVPKNERNELILQHICENIKIETKIGTFKKGRTIVFFTAAGKRF
ncbi:MAG: hypothetical protein RSD64_03450, partial [Christensenellaceae bacterium]